MNTAYSAIPFLTCPNVAKHSNFGADNKMYPQICGTIFYNNADSSVLAGCKVILMNTSNQAVDSTISDINGQYCFTGESNGHYHLRISCYLPWAGANSADALIIMKHFSGLYQLTGLSLNAARVNDDQYINSIDALMVAKRFVNQINSFPNGDWYFAPAFINYTGTSIIVNVKGICLGDVNCSYTPQ